MVRVLGVRGKPGVFSNLASPRGEGNDRVCGKSLYLPLHSINDSRGWTSGKPLRGRISGEWCTNPRRGIEYRGFVSTLQPPRPFRVDAPFWEPVRRGDLTNFDDR